MTNQQQQHFNHTLADMAWASTGRTSRVASLAEGIRRQKAKNVTPGYVTLRREPTDQYIVDSLRQLDMANRRVAQLRRTPTAQATSDPGRYWPHQGAQEVARRLRNLREGRS